MIKLLKSENGQASILFAFLLPIFIVLLGLAIDIGYYVVHKQKLQDAIDLAARSGAIEYSKSFNEGEMVKKIKNIGEKNGLTKGNIKIKTKTANENFDISVTSTETIDFFFINVFQEDSTTLTLDATVRLPLKNDFFIFVEHELVSSAHHVIWGGDIHVNNKFRSSGHYNELQTLEVVGDFVFDTSKNSIKKLIHPASYKPQPFFDVNFYKSIATKKFYRDMAFTNFHNDDVIYVDGNVTLDGGEVYGNVTIIATGIVTLEHSTTYANSDALLQIYSENEIRASQNGATYHASIQVPNGEFIVTGGEGTTLYGTINAYKFRISGEYHDFKPDERVVGKTASIRLME